MPCKADYQVPILASIPLIFLLCWTVMDHVHLPAKADNGTSGTGTTALIAPEAAIQDDALRFVFQLHRIPVNFADQQLLQTVSGIGPKLAGRIVAEREQGGPFQSAEDLIRVSGIGPKRINQFRKSLRFD